MGEETEATPYAEPVRLGPARALALAVGVAALTIVGWRLFYFLTDDAFIEFRYAGNLVLGRGLVWNPPPFTPVEGYTSLSWTLLLFAVWRLTGIEPPDSANVLSLVCGLATLALVIRLGLRMRWPAALARARVPLVLLAIFGTLTNRTFLTWLSSGLEASLFNLVVVAWATSVLELRTRRSPSALPVLAAAAMTLTRPDGLLFVAASVPIVLAHARRHGMPFVRSLRLAWPLALVALQLAFRVVTYGELLPNTYFAKHVAPWPESGLRYAAAFALEYAVYVWLVIVVAAAVRVAWPSLRRTGASAYLRDNAFVLAAGACLVGQLGYYTLIVGGDHFEFRPYSYAVPLLFLSATSCAAWMASRPLTAVAPVLLFVVLSWPIPWIHWWKSQPLVTREQTLTMVVPVADDVPIVLRPVAVAWDSLEAWLISHAVGVRHQEHKVFCEARLRRFPPREVGAEIGWERRAVGAAQTVGVLGWAFPHVAIIDLLGLNDAVIAHHPMPPGRIRMMAHDRSPPPGYVECFRPNFSVTDRRARVLDRPLPDDEIRRCEATWRARAGHDARTR